MEKLDYLIEYLVKENEATNICEIPVNFMDKKSLYRSLCNIREPKPISPEYLSVEDEYLQEELLKKEIVYEDDIKYVAQVYPKSKLDFKNKICLWRGDITTLKVDCIVNAANSKGLGCFIPCHKCVDNNIHSCSGVRLRLECYKKIEEIGNLETGKAFLTKGYNLLAKYIIHTVGPIINLRVTKENKEELANCYINSLKIAMRNGIRTIAFPCISTGEFKFPKKEASKIAIKAVSEFLDEHGVEFDKIIFNTYTNEDTKIYEQNLQNYYLK